VAGSAVIRGWARDVQRFADDWPADGIEVVDQAITDRLRADTGDGGLSHGRGMGRATTRVTKRAGEAEVAADGSMRVWGIIEGGTSAHTVTAKRGKMLRTPYGPRRSVHVSGIPARHTFTEGADTGLDAAARDAESAWARVGG
jgi:hypothetical protein